jgi:hypothetical protein
MKVCFVCDSSVGIAIRHLFVLQCMKTSYTAVTRGSASVPKTLCLSITNESSQQMHQIYFYCIVSTLHVSGPHWPIIRGVLVACLCHEYDKATARDRTDTLQHCMNQMVA